MGIEKHGGYLQVLEFLLLIENWMHGNSFTEVELNNVEIFFPIFMDKYKSVVDRQSGHKMKVRVEKILMMGVQFFYFFYYTYKSIYFFPISVYQISFAFTLGRRNQTLWIGKKLLWWNRRKSFENKMQKTCPTSQKNIIDV